MVKIKRIIRQIDKDKTRCVTNQELEDIIQIVYPQLENKKLTVLFENFCDPMNPVLISYKSFITKLEHDVLVFRAKLNEDKLSCAASKVQETVLELP